VITVTEQRNSDDIEAKLERMEDQIKVLRVQLNENFKRIRLQEQLLHNMAMRKLAEGRYLVDSATGLQRDIDFALEEVA